MPKFYLAFLETELYLVSRAALKTVKSIIRLVFDDNPDADELCCYLTRFDECRRVLDGSRNRTLAVEGFLENTLECGSD